MEDLVRFWKGKRVLVTGHTGFKGCWLSIWLHNMGAKVVGYSLKEYPNDILFNETGMSGRLADERGDIRDISRLNSVFVKQKPQIVFHLAAQPIVRVSYEYPVDTFETNIMGTVNVLECIRNSPSVKAGVMVTSDKCYENKEWVHGYREHDPVGGHDPYSCSKGCMELVVASYRKSFLKEQGKMIASARAGNVIGGGDWAKDRIVPDCVRALEAGKPIGVRNPASIRPWQHVLEPLSGYMLLAQRLFEGEPVDSAWNFGPNHDSILTVKQMVSLFLKHWGPGEWKDLSGEKNQPHEAKLLCLDISKARHLLHWSPKLSAEDAIGLTAEWYRNHSKQGGLELCERQIRDYESR